MKTHHLALHCLADLRCSREAIRDHWFFPYFITAALRISSCVNNQIRQTQMCYGLNILSLLCTPPPNEKHFPKWGNCTDFLNGKDVTIKFALKQRSENSQSFIFYRPIFNFDAASFFFHNWMKDTTGTDSFTRMLNYQKLRSTTCNIQLSSAVLVKLTKRCEDCRDAGVSDYLQVT